MNQEAGAGRRVPAYAPWIVPAVVAAYLVVAPNLAIYYSELETYNVWRRLQVMALAVVAGAFVLVPAVAKMVHDFLREVPRGALGALAAVGALGTASSLAAARPLYALREVALLALLLLLVASVAASAHVLGERFDRAAAHTFAIGSVFYLTIFFAILQVDPWGRGAWAAHPMVGFITPRFFGHLQSWTLPLVILPLMDLQPVRVSTRVVMWTAAAGWWLLFLVSGSRAPALSLVFAFLGMILLFGRRAIPCLRVHGVALAGAVVAYHAVPGVADSSTFGDAVERGASNNGRFEMWRVAIALLRDSPWLGVGPEHFAFYRRASGHSPAHPHNTALQWASEWGMPAALLLLGVLLWAVWRWSRARHGESGLAGQAVSVCLTTALFAAAVHSCFDGMAVMPLPQTFGAAIVGWALGVHLRRVSVAPIARLAPARAWACRIAVVAATAALVAGLRLPVRELVPGEHMAPRFWGHGAIP